MHLWTLCPATGQARQSSGPRAIRHYRNNKECTAVFGALEQDQLHVGNILQIPTSGASSVSRGTAPDLSLAYKLRMQSVLDETLGRTRCITQLHN